MKYRREVETKQTVPNKSTRVQSVGRSKDTGTGETDRKINSDIYITPLVGERQVHLLLLSPPPPQVYQVSLCPQMD